MICPSCGGTGVLYRDGAWGDEPVPCDECSAPMTPFREWEAADEFEGYES